MLFSGAKAGGREDSKTGRYILSNIVRRKPDHQVVTKVKSRIGEAEDTLERKTWQARLCC